MLSTLEVLFFPHQKNNQKAKVLHLSSLMVLLFLIVSFQSALSLITRFNPGILGFAANIDPEKLLELTNQRRLEQGLEPVEINEQLVEAARQKASTMFTFNCWSHNCEGKTPWWFFKNVGYEYLYAGENLARDFADSEAIVNAWMESPTHRDNILNNHYQEIGFAIVDGLLDGEETTLVVQMFGTQGEAPTLVGSGKRATSQVEGVLAQGRISFPEMMVADRSKPLLSSFMLTKGFSVTLLALLIMTLFLDTILIYRRQTVRISGKNFVHLSFFIIILISVLLSYQGEVL